ncbi:hypothetical protein, partial [Ectothiorhodospira sp. 9905]
MLELNQAGHRCRQIAEQLNAEGWRPAKRRETFNGPMVANLLIREGVRAGHSPAKPTPWPERGADEWPITELAFILEMPSVTLFSWIRKDWVQARQVVRAGRHQWLIWANEAEIERLRARRKAPR